MTPDSVTVRCRKCGQDMQIPAWERADMLVNGGWTAHDVCPEDQSS